VHRLRAMRRWIDLHWSRSGMSSTPTSPSNCSLSGASAHERCCGPATTHCRHSATHRADANVHRIRYVL
jgi:hypothetical protein